MGEYRKDNNTTKPQSWVVCAANKFPNGFIICGARHWDKIMHNAVEAIEDRKEKGVKGGKEQQGFINQFGEFLTREEAMLLVKENGQRFDYERNGDQDNKLFSEGIY